MQRFLSIMNGLVLMMSFNLDIQAAKKNHEKELESQKRSGETLKGSLQSFITSVDDAPNDVIERSLKGLNKSLRTYQEMNPSFKSQLKLLQSPESAVTESSCHLDMSHCPEPTLLKEATTKASFCCADNDEGSLRACCDTWGSESSHKPQSALSCLFCCPCVTVLLGGAAIGSLLCPCIAWKKSGAIIVWEPWNVDKKTFKANLQLIVSLLERVVAELEISIGQCVPDYFPPAKE